MSWCRWGRRRWPPRPQVGEPLKYQATGGRERAPGFRARQARSPRSELPTPDSPKPLPAASCSPSSSATRNPTASRAGCVEFPLKERGGQFHSASKDLQFAAAVASFGMILRGSEHRGIGQLARGRRNRRRCDRRRSRAAIAPSSSIWSARPRRSVRSSATISNSRDQTWSRWRRKRRNSWLGICHSS